MMPSLPLIVGIGSPRGDDRAGWLVVEELKRRLPDADARCARGPGEMLDWLGHHDMLVLCDAVLSNVLPGQVESWSWPTVDLQCERFRGTHDMTLVAALRIAEELQLLPRVVRIWGVTISSEKWTAGVSRAVADAVPQVASRICEELSHA
jgi:hydrogenase maturation protease